MKRSVSNILLLLSGFAVLGWAFRSPGIFWESGNVCHADSKNGNYRLSASTRDGLEHVIRLEAAPFRFKPAVIILATRGKVESIDWVDSDQQFVVRIRNLESKNLGSVLKTQLGTLSRVSIRLIDSHSTK